MGVAGSGGAVVARGNTVPPVVFFSFQKKRLRLVVSTTSYSNTHDTVTNS